MRPFIFCQLAASSGTRPFLHIGSAADEASRVEAHITDVGAEEVIGEALPRRRDGRIHATRGGSSKLWRERNTLYMTIQSIQNLLVQGCAVVIF